MRLWSGVVAVAVLAGAPAARVDEGMVPTIGESPAEAQSTSLSESGFQAYLPRLRAEALRAGVSSATIDRVFPSLTFSTDLLVADDRARSWPAGRLLRIERGPAVRALSGAAYHVGDRQPGPRALCRESQPPRRDRPPLRRPSVHPHRHLGQGDELRLDHGRFRSSQLARQPGL
jgi:hypothetical protein